ncbi:ATP-dependent DNA helicase [Miniphocaeibacter massiliensis]|uniref:ATP-dependent DNA helicase n=1 Tax=Miniphocaeibacter massiliensis TaxID=2041841 RepID=UPI000C1BE06E|nr:ATP-dependent DNA helicase [Miniphocaeibacter massiliensis]
METVKLSVHGLIDFVMRSGDIDNTFTSINRMKEGQKIHQKLQKEYGKYYEKEAVLKNETEYKDIVFSVEGRADGIFRKGKEVLIDEIKSTTRNLEDLKYNSNPLHWAQAKCYGYFYCVKNDLKEIDIQLTYYQVETDDIKRIIEKFKIEELEKFYLALLDLYLDFSIMIIKFRKDRDEHIKTLQFPFLSYRKGQRKMTVGVYRTIKEKKVLFAEAPTGIGKTMSTLFPSIKAVGEGLTDKIFYLTARTTTKEAANKAVYKLMDRGLRFKAVTITAKDKICINNEVKCNPKDCPFAKGHFDRVNDAILDIYENEEIMNMETIVEYSKKHKVCPMEFQLDMAIYSDLVICDYNYVFDPTVYLRRFFEGTVENYTFLVDESHNLVDRGRDMYSSEISMKRIHQVVNLLEDEDMKTKNRLNKLYDMIDEFYKISDNGKYYLSKYLDDEFLTETMVSMRMLEKFLTNKKEKEYYEDVLELYFELNKFLKISDFYSDNYVTLVMQKDGDILFKINCLDTSPIFKNILKRAESSVFFSATLSPIPFYADVLGAEEEQYYYLRLKSPFDPNNLKVGVVPLSTRYQHREENYDKIAKILENYTTKKGNYMLFFPSYKFMEEVYNRFDKEEKKVVKQESNLTELGREQFLNQFKHNSEIIAFVVLGGVFSEGIDLVGDRLIGAAIVSVGLPGISVERNLIKDYYDEKENTGFEYAYIYPGMNKVSQAAGRVIRDKDDKGTVLLIDDRFLKKQYRELLPKSWNKIKVVGGLYENKKNKIL